MLDHVRRVGEPAYSGDSFRVVADAYYDRVRYFFEGRGLKPDRSRELTQETFRRVFTGKGIFESIEEFEGWLFRIALNVFRNQRRNRRAIKRNAGEESLEQWIEEHPSGIPERPAVGVKNPLERYIDRERKIMLAEALRTLPPKMRCVMLLRLHHEFKYREIAEHLGISVQTVKAHLYQGRKRLHERLAELFIPDLEPPGDEEEG